MAEETKTQTTKADLNSPEFLKYLQESYEKVRDFGYALEAKQISDSLDRILAASRDLQSNNSDLYRQYQELNLKYKFAALPVLEADQVEKLLSESLLFGLALPEYSFKDAFDGFLATFSNDLDMASFMIKIENVMEKSNQRLGEESLDTKQGPADPTLANWIKEYIKENRDKEERGGFEQISFITNNKNAQKLSKEQQDLLKKVLDFYDWLKFPKENENVDFINPEIERAFHDVAQHPEKYVQAVLDAESGGKPTPPSFPEEEKAEEETPEGEVRLTGLTRVRAGEELPSSEPEPKAAVAESESETKPLASPLPASHQGGRERSGPPPKIDDLLKRDKTVPPPRQAGLPTPPRPPATASLGGPAVSTSEETQGPKMNFQSGLTHTGDSHHKEIAPPPIPSRSAGAPSAHRPLSAPSNLPTAKIPVKSPESPSHPGVSPSLAELAETRRQFESRSPKPPAAAKPAPPPPPPQSLKEKPPPMKKSEGESKGFSLNEAIIRGNLKEDDNKEESDLK